MSVKSIVVKAFICVLVIVMLVAAVILLKNINSDSEQDATGETLTNVYTADFEKLTSIEINSFESFTLLKQEAGNWVMEGMEGVGTQEAYVNALIKSMTDINSPMLIQEDATDLEKYGLGENAYNAKLVFEDGEQLLKIGNMTGDSYYFCVDGTNDVYIVTATDLYMFFVEKVSFLDTTLVNINMEDITRISYRNVVIEKSDGFWFEKSPYDRLCDESVLNARVLPKAAYITAEDVIKSDDVTLGEGETVIIEASTGESWILEVYLGDKSGYSYVKPIESEYVYKVYTADLSFIESTGFEVMIKYPMLIPLSDVTMIEMISHGRKTTLTVDAPQSEAPIFYVDGEMAEEESFRNFYATLVSLTFKGEGKAKGSGEYEIIFTHVNGEKTKLEFINLSDTDYAVNIDGEMYFTVAKKNVTDIFEALKNIEEI